MMTTGNDQGAPEGGRTTPASRHGYFELIGFAAWAMSGIAVVVFLYARFVIWLVGAPDGAGTFGDMFGALNVVFAGLGFAGVIYTIRNQGQDAAEMHKRHVESLALLEREVEILSESLRAQQHREQVEAGPFLLLKEERFHNGALHLVVENVGASVLCQGVASLRTGDAVRKWAPSAFVAGGTLTVELQMADPQAEQCELRMKFRDRLGKIRHFDVFLARNHPRREASQLDFQPAAPEEAPQ